MGELRLGEGGLLRFQRQNKQSRGAHTATRAHGAAARKAPFLFYYYYYCCRFVFLNIFKGKRG